MAHGAASRDRHKERHWRKIVRGKREGESIRAYCRAKGVNEAAFYWWRRELAQRDGAKSPAAFVPVTVATSSGQPEEITIELRGGRVLSLPATVAAARVVELVRAIEGAA